MGKKLLIVDDKREIRLVVKSTLEFEFEDCEVIEAETGDEAVEAAFKHHPDLVIMDMIMPGKINGIEATKRIKANPETSDCKIIMLSGSELGLRPQAMESGISEFIQKPFSPLDLIEKVDSLFGNRV
jgi:CheY-like chemotaxis protein